MSRLAQALSLTLLLAPGVAIAQTVEGTWTYTDSGEGLNRIKLSVDESNRRSTNSMLIGEIPQDTVKLEITRDAGQFTFEGIRRGPRAAGFFKFVADPEFNQTLHQLDFETLDDDNIYLMGALGAKLSDAGRLDDLGYGYISGADFILMQISDVLPDYIEKIAALGYDDLEVDELVAIRNHGITPRYVEQMKQAGVNIRSIDDLISMRIHGVSPEFVAEMQDLDLGTAEVDELTSMRIHGITPSFVREMGELGICVCDIDELFNLRTHGVTPDFAKEVIELGYPDVTVDELVSLRIHSISPSYIRKVSERVDDDDDDDDDDSVDRIVKMKIRNQ